MTIDNFFTSGLSDDYKSEYKGNPWTEISIAERSTLHKEYDQSTGVLTFYSTITAGAGPWSISMNVSYHCYLIVNPKIA